MKPLLSKEFSVTQKLCLSFILVILIGSILLSLPIFHKDTSPQTTYLDHLFTVVSMVCVTGLSVFPITDVYNVFGQVIALLLIQIGGLGLVTLIALSYFTVKKKLSLNDQSILQSSLSQNSSSQLKSYLISVYYFTFGMEFLAALLLMIDFIPRFGLKSGIFNAIFLAVSAFCNAGFDNLGSSSLITFQTNTLVNLVIAGLIIAGGLGFANWFDIIAVVKDQFREKPYTPFRRFRRLKIQTRLVLQTTGIILTLGTLVTWLLELQNPNTLGKLPPFHQLLTAFFQTVTMRTAGFATIDYNQALPATNFSFIVQMIIGGAPGGTAGGIKLACASLIYLLFRAEFRGERQVTFSGRSIPEAIMRQVLTILVFFFSVFVIGYFLLLIAEPTLSPFALLFETASALATSGVSMNLTSQIGTFGRIVLICLMFIGRVGPITVILSLSQKQKTAVTYPKTDISLG